MIRFMTQLQGIKSPLAAYRVSQYWGYLLGGRGNKD